MPEYGFSLIHIFPYYDRIVNFFLIPENTGQRKPVFSMCGIFFLNGLIKFFTEKALSNLTKPVAYSEPFFSIWVFFQEHSRFIGQQGKGEGIS